MTYSAPVEANNVRVCEDGVSLHTGSLPNEL